MKALCFILSHSGANAMLPLMMPWYERSACDLIGVGRTDKRVIWPPSQQYMGWFDHGVETYVRGDDNHLRRLIACLDWFRARTKSYTHAIVVEYDCIFPRCVPDDLAPGISAHTAGGNSDGFIGSSFVHTPWIFSAGIIPDVIRRMEIMIAGGLLEHGFTDRWIGLFLDMHKGMFRFNELNQQTYSQNSLDRPEFIQQARDAIKRGCWHIHGIKTAAALRQVTEGLL